jgi:SAM-dependent methyltransferase
MPTKNNTEKPTLRIFRPSKKNGKRRLGIIKALFAENLRKTVPAAGERADSPLTLLDIGCAYGPFLEAAGEEGFVPAGMDPSEDAVRYVREQLKFQAFRGFFPDDIPLPDNIPLPDDIIRSAYKKGPFIRNAYNAVTFWFVIEHLKDSGASLAAANRLLTPGGVLAFSTPSFSGVSRRRSLRAFLENSPADHWTIWDPGKCAGILSRYGFTVRKRVITGHHPERFPLAGRFLKPGGAAYRLFRMISRVFGLGDTFEVYAVKTRELSTGNRDG